MINTQRNKTWHKENEAGEFIPYDYHVNENTVRTKGGDYIQILRIKGIAHESADIEDIIVWKNQLSMLLKSLAAPNIGIWTNIIRREENSYPDGTFRSGFSKQLDDKYKIHIAKTKMYVNDLYLSLIYRPVITSKGFFRKLENEESLRIHQRANIEKLDHLSELCVSALDKYGAKRLGLYENQGLWYSELLEFLSYLANGEYQPRVISNKMISESLPFNRIFFGADAFEIRGALKRRFGVMLAIGEYPEGTEAGFFNALLSTSFNCVITQSFQFLSKPAATSLLLKCQNRMKNSGDLAVSLTDAIDDALDDLTADRMVYGYHHMSIAIYGDNLRKVQDNLSDAHKEMVACAITVAREDWGLSAAYWAQLPGNFQYRPRPSPISSRNFAGFSSLHNFPVGEKDRNQWGAAVTLLKTSSGSPYYFNFHEPLDSKKLKSLATDEKEQQKCLGNTYLVGPSGSGKTVLQGFLVSQSQKFDPYQIIFDKDRGLEIYVRAERGSYLTLENGKPTNFNPFSMEPTERNFLFLESLIRKCIGKELSPKEERNISNAIRGVMRLSPELRRMSSCLQFLDPTDEDGVYSRLSKWCYGGSLDWVFDNETDLVNFNDYKMFGFDVTDFLENDTIRTPVIMYLFHRMEELFDGRRIQIFMDEFWRLLQDEYFEEFAQNKLKVIRKQNGHLVLGTQSAADVLKSKIAHSIVEQCATAIYLPNPKARKEDYIDGFHLSKREFQLIKEDLLPSSRKFLIKQGNASVIAELDLKGFQNELSIISGTSDNVHLLEKIISEHGADPDVWVPIFHEKRRAA